MNCPCGCGVELTGRQRAASPACRQRISRGRKRLVKCHTLEKKEVSEPKCDNRIPVSNAFPDVPDRWHMDGSGCIDLVFPDQASAFAYMERQRSLANNRGENICMCYWPHLRYEVGKKEGIPTGGVQVRAWYGPIYADHPAHGVLDLRYKDGSHFIASVVGDWFQRTVVTVPASELSNFRFQRERS